jgi:hypothetical protein
LEVSVGDGAFPTPFGVKSKKRETRKGSEIFTIMGGV